MYTQQGNFFDQRQPELLDLPGAHVKVLRGWLPVAAAEKLYHHLLSSLPWSQPTIRVAGRSLPIPRLQTWIGDSDAYYGYSGRGFLPVPWLTELERLKAQLEQACGGRFNSVLANFYRDGNDSVAYHADDEGELGDQPVIASLSLGGTRRFLLKPKDGYATAHPGCALDLANGDLLIMAGDTQTNWLHSVPKTRKPCGSRMNLTFRQIKRAVSTHKGTG